MLPQKIKKAITDNPKQLANLIDLVNLPSTLRDFVGQSQISHLGCFKRVWSYIKTNNLQISLNKLHIHFDGVGTLETMAYAIDKAMDILIRRPFSFL